MFRKKFLPMCRGFWYDIRKWGARSHTCDSRPDSVACMACSQNLPNYAYTAGVVPIGEPFCINFRQITAGSMLNVLKCSTSEVCMPSFALISLSKGCVISEQACKSRR